jgi:c-di-GMP-binding flagellar brake protein YcgR
MVVSELEIGTKLELERIKEDGTRAETLLVSEFEWFAAPGEAVIAAPILEGSIVPLHPGTLLNVFFIKRREDDIQLYKFEARVAGRERSENLHLLRIEMPGEIEKVQRRNYYRLNCSLQAQYRIVDEINEVYNEDIPFKKTITNNISGGGVNLLLEDRIEAGKLVECEVFTSRNKKVRFFGKVVRYERNEVESKYRYEAGIAYVTIRSSDREAVVQFIFEEQRKLRKKGLI